jgi:hypothetical protein
VLTDHQCIAILNQASALTANPNQFDFLELRQLRAKGALSQLPSPVAAGATYQSPGEECTPGDTAPGLVCQPTQDWVVAPSELLNGFKGDMVVHHACGDMIANLLSSIGQNYSHSMTVSKNHVEIRHSTAAEDRITGSVNFATEQLDPQKTQFAFPGTNGLMPYTVDQMVNGYCVPEPTGASNGGSDPACPGGWHILGSLHPDPLQCATDLPIVYPLIVRPPPSATTAQLQAITPVGDQALAITGHYRFFMYSRADEFVPATSGPAWANGTEETVCSLFDLESTRHAAAGSTALPLGGGGGSLPDGTPIPDGMRKYTVDERAKGAVSLYTQVFNQVEAQLPPGWAVALGALTGGFTQAYLNDLANRIANQINNCFATDSCADTSAAWTNITSGIAVAPDDIVNIWQLPPTGTYGYNEPLAYAPTSFRHKYEWAPVAGDAQMTVIVVDGSNNPFPNATVVLNGAPAGTTDATGTLVIPSVAQGSYDVAAQAYIGPPGGTQPPPPTPTPLPPSQVLALPACVNAPLSGFSSPCSVTGSDPSCPPLWGSECVLGSTASFPSTCACFAPPMPALTCDLTIADRMATVPASGSVTVELTLCTNCLNGVPQSCTQHCATNADCQNTQICSSGNCVAQPRIVTVQTSSDSSFKVEVDNLLGAYQNATQPLSLSFTCDPNSSSSGGTAVQTACHNTTATVGFITESTDDLATFTVQCQEDQTGGIGITLSYSLAENCGSPTIHEPSATLAQNCESAPPTGSQTVHIAPAGPSDSTPSASLSFDACYASDPEAVFQCPCDANEVHTTWTFTSVPAP